MNAMMERYQLNEAMESKLDASATLAGAALSAPRAAERKAATTAAERRAADRPWSARPAARAAAAKPAQPTPRFAKVVDDDMDWKEF